MKKNVLISLMFFLAATSFSQDIHIIDLTKTNRAVTLEKTPEYLEFPILKIAKRKKVEVIEYVENEYWKIRYKEHVGYVMGNSLIVTNKMNEEVKVFKKKVTNDSIKEIEKLKEERQSRLLSEFTEEEVLKIENQEIWIGMTTSAAIEMFGIPSDRNRSTGSWGVHEQWVYEEKDLYLYFEDRKLTSWQD